MTNYIKNRSSYSLYTNLLEVGFFKLFFGNNVIKILLKEITVYTNFHL